MIQLTGETYRVTDKARPLGWIQEATADDEPGQPGDVWTIITVGDREVRVLGKHQAGIY